MNTQTPTLPSHVVRARRYYYGPKETSSIAHVGSLQECKDFIRRDGDSPYYTEQNESGRWSLRIVTSHSLGQAASMEAADRLREQAFA